jgi:hypothetical protein
VVRTAQALADLALGLLDDPGAAVAADVQEGARSAVLAADDQDAVGTELADEELAGLVDGRDVPGDDPAAKDLIEFPVEHRLVGERRRREHRGAFDGLLGERHVARVEVELDGRIALRAHGSASWSDRVLARPH